MINTRTAVFLLSAALLFSSCEKVVTIDHHQVNPHLVVEGGYRF